MTLKQGDQAPDFNIRDYQGQTHSIADYKGQWILLYFYPKDNTPGCTTEACSFRDHFSDFQKKDLVIIGVSTDDEKSHQKFIEEFQLPFLLLSDTERKVVKDYGVWGKKKFRGKEYMGINRSSFLIDPKGKIVKIYLKVKPDEHAQEVLNDIDHL